MRAAVARCLLAFAAAAASGLGHADPGGDYHGLVEQGEQALRRNDPTAAVRAYERAAALRHEAVAEWGLVRSWMQAGEYRRALAFSAHAAGAHTGLVEGAGLYAWLLHIGGQTVIAQQTLAAALLRQPDNAVLLATAARLRGPASVPDAHLLEGATRQAPHTGAALPPTARAVGSGLLLPGGAGALVPADTVTDASALWLRDAQGRTVAARAVRTLPELGLAELALDAPLRDVAPPWPVAQRDAFAGSPQMVVGFAAPADAPLFAAWPVLQTGFLGRWQAGPAYSLGTELAGPTAQGGPVFDRSGRLIGVALRGGAAGASLLAASALSNAWPQAFVPAPADAPQLSPDIVYERAMAMVVQVVAQPHDSGMR